MANPVTLDTTRNLSIQKFKVCPDENIVSFRVWSVWNTQNQPMMFYRRGRGIYRFSW